MKLVLCTARNANATGNDLKPTLFSSKTFAYSVVNYARNFVPAAPKVCACQILEVNSNNEKVENLALFAEASSYGDLTREQKIATSVLEKERKNMKYFFYSRIKLRQTIVAAMDCKKLFQQLQTGDSPVKMYDIIDADIRTAVAKN